MRGAAAFLLAALCLIAAAGAAIGSADASRPGAGRASGPRFEACVGEDPVCSSPAAGSLRGAADLAVAPDGGHLYVGAFGGDAVEAFAIGRGGKLRFDGCVADAGSSASGCAATPEGTLEGPAAIVATRGSLFVASQRSDAVVRLALRRGGHPTFDGCVAAAGDTCAAESRALRGPTALALGPGGRDLYVASAGSASLTRLRTGGGRLRSDGCLAYAGAAGCARARKNSLRAVDGIAVAPDGRSAYAIAFASAAVTELGRSRDGSLGYRGCVGDAALADCRPLGGGSLTGAAAIAIAPDGRALFVASQVGTIGAFRIGPSGRLVFAGCLGDDGVGGCDPVPDRLLAGATGLAISPDGTRLYVASFIAGSLVEVGVGRGARLRLLGCSRVRGRGGCAAAPAASLRGAYALATTPDGRLFGAAARGSLVASFAPGSGAAR